MQTRRRRLPAGLANLMDQVRGLSRGRPGAALRIVVTVILLGVLFVRSDLRSVRIDLSITNVPLIAGVLTCSYAIWALNTYRWQRILASYAFTYPFWELFRLNLVSILYSLALPGQVSGELIKALRLGSRETRRQTVYASVLFDRVYGVIGLAVLGWIGLALSPPTDAWSGRTPGLLVFAAIVLAGFGVLALPWLAQPVGRLLTWRSLGRRLLNAATVGGEKPSAWFVIVGCVFSLAPQVLTAGIQWAIAVALGITVSPLALTWVMVFATFAAMFPISLAGFGVREATYVGLLALFDVPSAAALALSLAMAANMIALGLTGGILDLVMRRAPVRSS